jgi:signal recognition particle subunit SRP54
VVAVVGVPIVFSGIGERLDDLEVFRPDRVVSRMLGMGDILTLVERAEKAVSSDRAREVERRVLRDQLTLDDLREQLRAVERMGPLDQLMSLIPGMNRLPAEMAEVDPKQLSRTGAIIDSMTPGERKRPPVINGSRRKRIARGSGSSVEEVNRLLRQFAQMRKMLKTVRGLGGKAGKTRKAKRRRGIGRMGMLGPGPALH